MANSVGQLACLRGYRVRFVLAADLVNDLVAGQAKNTLHRSLAAWSAPDLLLIDELGYLSFDARGADLLYQVFNRRYQRASTIVTTNLPFKDWGKLFHNSAAASAIAEIRTSPTASSTRACSSPSPASPAAPTRKWNSTAPSSRRRLHVRLRLYAATPPCAFNPLRSR